MNMTSIVSLNDKQEQKYSGYVTHEQFYCDSIIDGNINQEKSQDYLITTKNLTLTKSSLNETTNTNESSNNNKTLVVEQEKEENLGERGPSEVKTKVGIKRKLISSSSPSSCIMNKLNESMPLTSNKRRKNRDPNEPQKPVSPYALFFRDTQSTIKITSPNATFGEISKIVASMWEQLDPEVKDEYKRRTAHAKKDYLRQLATYKALQVNQTQSSLNSANDTSKKKKNTQTNKTLKDQQQLQSSQPTGAHNCGQTNNALNYNLSQTQSLSSSPLSSLSSTSTNSKQITGLNPFSSTSNNYQMIQNSFYNLNGDSYQNNYQYSYPHQQQNSLLNDQSYYLHNYSYDNHSQYAQSHQQQQQQHHVYEQQDWSQQQQQQQQQNDDYHNTQAWSYHQNQYYPS